jgi:hypothetical protein
MRNLRSYVALTVLGLCLGGPANAQKDASALTFERTRIGTATYEAASVFDVDRNGILDIVSGEYWFEGPDFTTQHKIGDIQKVEDYYDDFSSYPMDVNGDGFLDIVSGGWWGETLLWRENPQDPAELWKTHDIDKTGSIERPCFWDIDGDGNVEVVPNCPGKPFMVFKLVTDAGGKGAGEFTKHIVSDTPQGHGLGFGDVNGDGRGDLVSAAGWLEAPTEVFAEQWTWHSFVDAAKNQPFDCGSASVPMLVYDVNSDGLNDLIVGQGHAYGLAWHQQGKDQDGHIVWAAHDIDQHRSQYHELQLVDIDNDGELELITGKRYRAHQGHDPGALDPIGTYYFDIDKTQFKRNTIDYGPAGEASGVGIYFWVEDVDGNGWKDLVAPGKDGLFLFKNLGPVKR